MTSIVRASLSCHNELYGRIRVMIPKLEQGVDQVKKRVKEEQILSCWWGVRNKMCAFRKFRTNGRDKAKFRTNERRDKAAMINRTNQHCYVIRKYLFYTCEI